MRLLIVLIVFAMSMGCSESPEAEPAGEDSDVGSEMADVADPTADEDVAIGNGEQDRSDVAWQDTGDGDTGPSNGADPDSDPLGCPSLPMPSASIVEVSQENLGDLPHLVRTAEEGTHFVFEPGTYELPNTLHVRSPGLSFRSATGDAADVVLDGRYEVNSLFLVQASAVTIAHLTLTRANHHGVHISPAGDAQEDVVDMKLYGLRVVDISQQFVKVNPNGERSAFVDDGRLECSSFELTDAGRPHVDPTATGCYTGGIDAHSAKGWVVRNNEFIDIYCDGAGLAEHAVHFWSAARDTVVENNRIINCARGVGFGLVENGNTRDYEDDPGEGVDGYIGHFGGVIRNNLIYADHQWYDTGIELAQARGARVYHNTIYSPEASGAFSSIDYRFENSQVVIRNNLVDRITRRSDAQGEVDHNLEEVTAELFVDAAAMNFRLAPTATEAIDQGVEVDEAGIDLDGNARTHGDGPDLGAYEFVD